MKILIAPDSFKDCLHAHLIAKYLQKGLYQVLPTAEIISIPMADGGEGTVEAIVEATGGTFIKTTVHDALMRKIEAGYGVSGDKRTAVIEMASASGIELLKPEERNPWMTGTYGTGELIKDALDKGYRRILTGIGGSATNDGGTGMASALGVSFYDSENKKIDILTGGSISNLKRIDFSRLDPRISECEIIVASDVKNWLTGPEGASFIYAAQKGADAEMQKKLDINLHKLAEIIANETGKKFENIAGSGAAGGLGFGLMAFLGAKMHNGFDLIANETHLEESCQWADYVITAEGKIDNQTVFGKTPQGVANLAKKHDKTVIAFAGTLGEGYEVLYEKGFDIILPIIEKPMLLSEAISTTPKLLVKTGIRIGHIIKIIEQNRG